MVRDDHADVFFRRAYLGHALFVGLVDAADSSHTGADEQLDHAHRPGHHDRLANRFRLMLHASHAEVVARQLGDLDPRLARLVATGMGVGHGQLQQPFLIVGFLRSAGEETHGLPGDQTEHAGAGPEQLQRLGIVAAIQKTAQPFDSADEHFLAEQRLGQVGHAAL